VILCIFEFIISSSFTRSYLQPDDETVRLWTVRHWISIWKPR